MKAIYYEKYGTPDVLTLRELPKPLPKENEMLIKVRAASINSWDWDMIRGEPFIVRMWGLFGPKYKIPGSDIAGTVEVVGRSVTKFKVGDEVFGDIYEQGWGGFAEYACAKEQQVAIKPQSMGFDQAAAIPQAGLMALQSVRDLGTLAGNQHVLFNGAGGGVGTFGIQLAKLAGAEVTVVDSAEKLEFLKSLGADHMIDYRREDFTNNGKTYDLIVDVVSSGSILRYKKSLKRGGRYVMIGGTMPAIFQMMTLGSVRSGIQGITKDKEQRHIGLMGYKANVGLDDMSNYFIDGKVTPVIDKSFDLSETADAFRYFAQGRFKGKIVIAMNNEE